MSTDQSTTKSACAHLPELERLNFFYGQMLSADDFRTEQAYFREKIKLHNRCLHGWGVVCGLEVEPRPIDPVCIPADEGERRRICEELERIDATITEIEQRLESEDLDPDEAAELKKKRAELIARREELWRRKEELCLEDEKKDPCLDDEHVIGVVLHCGLALDCCGNELIVRERLEKNLWSLIAPSDRRKLKEKGSGDLYLSICYCAQPTHPSRPVLPDSCGTLTECNFGRYRDSFKLEVTLEPPPEETRCEPCCEPCEVHCVLLAKVHWDRNDKEHPMRVDNSVRRPLSRYHATVISGISWQHGGVYGSDQAKEVLGTAAEGGRTNGLEIQFSRPVYAQSLQPGVIELLRVQGGRGLRGVISHMEGAYVALDEDGDGCVTRVQYRDETGETLNSGDRVIVIVRADFILDKCCQPVDGNHIGGRVPLLEGFDPPRPVPGRDEDCHDNGHKDNGGDRPMPCKTPLGGVGVWRSGNGAPGGSFESWFFVK